MAKTTKANNSNLHNAKAAKNDEFFTMLPDIERELCHYKQFLKGKSILCNCDDPDWSNFWKYFYLNFEHLGIKRLVSTHYDPVKPTYMMYYDGKEMGYSDLKGNGDFRSPECIELLKQCDVVVTNPPFSLFRAYIDVLVSHGKDFIVIGNKNAITYKETFKLIKDGKVLLGKTSPKVFATSIDHERSEPASQPVKTFGNIGWFTSLDISFAKDPVVLFKTYKGNEHLYPKYDNYDAINVDKTVDIPIDYYGYMGVPITFLDKSFELIDNAPSDSRSQEMLDHTHRTDIHSPEQSTSTTGRSINGLSFNVEACSAFSSEEHDGTGALYVREREREGICQNTYTKASLTLSESLIPQDQSVSIAEQLLTERTFTTGLLFNVICDSRYNDLSNPDRTNNVKINGKETYRRIIIQRTKQP